MHEQKKWLRGFLIGAVCVVVGLLLEDAELPGYIWGPVALAVAFYEWRVCRNN